VRLLLDEMWSPRIAAELRKRGFDVIAIAESEIALGYAGDTDQAVFARAQRERRAIVTDNVADFEQARGEWETQGNTHYGVLYALNPPFNRHRAGAVGPMTLALEYFLASPEAKPEPFNRIHFVRTAPQA